MVLIGVAYLSVVAIGTLAVYIATSDRYRSRFQWLIQDDPEEQR